MDLGLGNLIELKRNLLNPQMLTQTTYDAIITAIGRGVAARFEKFCNRRWTRTVGDVWITTADRAHVYLPRFPVESIASLEQRDNQADAWRTLASSQILQQDNTTGYVFFGAMLGMWFSQLRFTYTGGFWYDTSEDASGTLPAGATALPADLRLAWYLQCSEIWDRRDKLGISIANKPESWTALKALELVPEVQTSLRAFTRYQIA